MIQIAEHEEYLANNHYQIMKKWLLLFVYYKSDIIYYKSDYYY